MGEAYMTIRDLVRKSINAIDATSGLFYQQNIQEGYSQLEKTLAIISELAHSLYITEEDDEELPIDCNNFNAILTDVMNAMEQKDTILMADILQYDLKSLLENGLK